MNYQTWVCLKCGATRTFGIGLPDNESATLLCNKEREYTLHIFDHMSNTRIEGQHAIPKAHERLLGEEFRKGK
jgi:hypothetical protein